MGLIRIFFIGHGPPTTFSGNIKPLHKIPAQEPRVCFETHRAGTLTLQLHKIPARKPRVCFEMPSAGTFLSADRP